MGGHYLTPYARSVQEHGATFPALLWASRETQEARFAALVRLARLGQQPPATILDVGCGLGDLHPWLIRCGIRFAGYAGVDATPQFIDEASVRLAGSAEGGSGWVPAPPTFICADPLLDVDALRDVAADWGIISGTLNTMEQEQAQRLVEIVLGACRIGVAFNFLSDRPSSHHPINPLGPSIRHSTVRWMEWALAKSPLVAFEQRHLGGHDAAIVIEHAPA